MNTFFRYAAATLAAFLMTGYFLFIVVVVLVATVTVLPLTRRWQQQRKRGKTLNRGLHHIVANLRKWSDMQVCAAGFTFAALGLVIASAFARLGSFNGALALVAAILTLALMVFIVDRQVSV